MEEKKSNGFAIAALVLGILSILSSFTIMWVGLRLDRTYLRYSWYSNGGYG